MKKRSIVKYLFFFFFSIFLFPFDIAAISSEYEECEYTSGNKSRAIIQSKSNLEKDTLTGGSFNFFYLPFEYNFNKIEYSDLKIAQTESLSYSTKKKLHYFILYSVFLVYS